PRANEVACELGVRPGQGLDVMNETVAGGVEVDVEVRERSTSSGGKVLPAGTEVRCRVVDRQTLVDLFRRKLFLDIIVWTHGPNTLQLVRRRTVRQAVQDVRNEQVIGAQRHSLQPMKSSAVAHRCSPVKPTQVPRRVLDKRLRKITGTEHLVLEGAGVRSQTNRL